MFTCIRNGIEEFAQQHGVDKVYLQAKASRKNIYEQLAGVLAPGHVLLKLHEPRLQQGRDWFIFIQKDLADI